MGKKFQDILDKIDREAKEDGAEQEVALLREHFRFGRFLAARRLELGLSQQALARTAGVQQAEISRIEGGGGNPTFDTLNSIVNGLRGRLEFRPTKRAPSRRRSRR